MERADAERLATEWVEAWNARRVDDVLAHYAEDVVVVSPLAVERGVAPDGKVRGKDAVRRYYESGLAARPSLHFTIEDLGVGVDSFTILYHDERGRRVAETLVLSSGSAVLVMANYGPEPEA
jgi:ketosteroid isomerase-like protein